MAEHHKFAVVTAIDGVLAQNGKLLPGVKEAMRRLCFTDRKGAVTPAMPFVFLTNGCGITEAEKAKQLSKSLGISVSAEHVILGHSPMRDLLIKFADKRLLIVGKEHIDAVAKDYGFTNFITLSEYAKKHPLMFPHKQYPDAPQGKAASAVADETFDAVMVMQTPSDWGESMQVLCDVLRTRVKGLQIPLFFANPDVVHSDSPAAPRFAQGAFRLCLAALYRTITGHELAVTQFGKPLPTTYRYTEAALVNQIIKAQQHTHTTHTTVIRRTSDGDETIESRTHTTNVGAEIGILPPVIYAIGDNPLSDIAGANNAGSRWHSILALSGCWRGPGNHKKHAAKHIAQNFSDAVAYLLEREGMPNHKGPDS